LARRQRAPRPDDHAPAAGAVRRTLISLAVPPGFDGRRARPILLINATSDPRRSTSCALREADRPAAAAAGRMIVAAKPEPALGQDDDRFGVR
jgi:hypothetical protein